MDLSTSRLRNHRVRIAIVTAALVVLVLLGYYLRFTGSLDRIHVRNLRLLSVMSTQVEDALNGYVSVLKNIAENSCPGYLEKPERFLNQQTSLYAIPPGQVKNCRTNSERCASLQQDLEGVLWLRLSVATHAASTMAADKTSSSNPALAQKGCRGAAASPIPVSAGVNLSSEFEYFMPADEFGDRFDLVLISNAKGEVVYQTPYTQLHVANLKSLFDAGSAPANPDPKITKNVQFDLINGTSTLTQVKLGGIAYDLYSQPIRLPSNWSEELTGPQWMLCAFSRPMTSYKEALRISYPFLLGLIDLLALAFFALPWIRLRFLTKHERLRRRDVAFAAAAAFFGVVFAFAIPVYWVSVQMFKQQAVTQVTRFAEKARTQIEDELEEIIDYAEAANRQLQSMPPDQRTIQKTVLKSNLGDGAKNPGFVSPTYAFADLVFWLKENGDEAYKWSAFEDVSPFVNVSTMQFYLQFSEELPYRLDGREFYLGSVLAPTTGSYKAVIGLTPAKANQTATAGTASPAAQAPTSDGIAGVFVVAQPRSMFRTVVSSGFAFCVVDSRSGNVLFHSDSRRNGNENLFHETDDNESLKGAIAARRGLVEVNYRGRDDLAWVTPFKRIDGSPLVLVVFADRSYYETTAAEIAGVALMLYSVYVVIVSCMLALIWVFMRPVRFIELIWPQPDAAWRYLSSSGIAALFLAVMAAWCGLGRLDEVWFGGLFLGALAATIILFLLSPKMSPFIVVLRTAGSGAAFSVVTAAVFGLNGRWTIPALTVALTVASCAIVWGVAWRAQPRPPRLELLPIYTTMILLILGALSVAPAAISYRVANRYETELLLKYGQTHIAHEIQRRQNEMQWLMTSDRFDADVIKQWRSVQDDSRGFYHKAFYQSTIDVGGKAVSAPEQDPIAAFMARLMTYVHTPLNTIAIRMGAIAKAELPLNEKSKDSPDAWRSDRSDTTLTYSAGTLDGQAVRISSQVPPMGMFGNQTLWISVVLMSVLAYMGFRSGIRRIFVMDWRIPEPARPIDLPDPLNANYIALTQTAPPQELLADRKDLFWIDVAEIVTSGRRAETLAAVELLPAQAVAIRHFDYDMGDLDLNLWKLELLERLVIGRGLNVVLLTTADPSYYFETQEELPDTQRHRWRLLLRAFLKLRIQRQPAPEAGMLPSLCRERLNPDLPKPMREVLLRYLDEECGKDPQLSRIALTLPLETFRSRMDILAEVERYAANYYTYLWDTCSREEQILLYQIARYRFANPLAGEAAYQLHRKGLITNDPTKWLMNRTFRRYIRSKPEPEPMKASQNETLFVDLERSAVIVLLAVALPLVVGAIILVPESPQQGLGVFTTALATLGSLTKLLGGRKAATGS